jgi:hypothetical protein
VVLQVDFENFSDAYQKMPLVERKPFLYISISEAGNVLPPVIGLFAEDVKKLKTFQYLGRVMFSLQR